MTNRCLFVNRFIVYRPLRPASIWSRDGFLLLVGSWPVYKTPKRSVKRRPWNDSSHSVAAVSVLDSGHRKRPTGPTLASRTPRAQVCANWYGRAHAHTYRRLESYVKTETAGKGRPSRMDEEGKACKASGERRDIVNAVASGSEDAWKPTRQK